MRSSNTQSPLRPWELREEDIASGAIELLDQYTCFVGDCDAPPCIQKLHSTKVTLCKTDGNGKCALHAVLGVPYLRKLKVKDERGVLLTLFNGSYGNVKSRLLQQDMDTGTSGVVVLDNVFSEIWPSFIQPCMELEIKGNITDSAQDRQERCYYETEIRKDSNLMNTFRNAYLVQEEARAVQEDRKVNRSVGLLQQQPVTLLNHNQNSY